MWETGEQKRKYDFDIKVVKEINDEVIKKIEDKVLYNLDNKVLASYWVRKEVKNLEVEQDIPHLSSACKVKINGNLRGGLVKEKCFGFFYNSGNAIYYSGQFVGIFSSVFSAGNGLSIIKENLLKCTALFTARRVIKNTWINHEDEYIQPDTKHKNYKQFENDSLVYSLFDSKSQQLSLLVNYKGKEQSIKNNFFFMSKDVIGKKANEKGWEKFNVKNEEERYIFVLLKTMQLSPDAKEILDLAKNLVIKSFEYRKIFNNKYPEYQVMRWDAGWYQIRQILS